MSRPTVKFSTSSSVASSLSPENKTTSSRPASNESLRTTTRRFLNAPEVPISDEEARKREQKLKELEREKTRGLRKKKKRKSLNNHQIPEPTDEESKRAKELQEAIIWSESKKDAFEKLKNLMLRHMRTLDDLVKLRNHYYHEYKDKLDAKVTQQRKDINKKTKELNRQIELKKQKEIEASHHVKSRLSHSVQAVDNTFLKSLPKSRLYQVMVVQSKLMRQGRFTCIEDIEQFWQDVSDPDTLNKMMEGVEEEEVAKQDEEGDIDEDARSDHSNHSDNSGPGSQTSSSSSLQQCDKIEGGYPLSRIVESSEPTNDSISRRNTGNETMLSVKNNKNKQFKSRGRKSVHPKVAEMEQRYPRVDFPEMMALYTDLDPPKEAPEIVEMREDYQQKSRVRDREKKRLRKMYEMSLTHQASTQRIFDKNEDFSQVMNSLSIADVGGMLHTHDDDHDPESSDYYSSYPSYNPSVPLPLTYSQPRSNSNPMVLSSITRLLEDTIPEEREEDLVEGRSLSRHSPLRDDDISMGRTRSGGSRTRSVGHRQKSRNSNDGRRETSANSIHTKRKLEPIAARKLMESAPLTIDAVIDTKEAVVKDVNCLSTLWTNYARDLPAVR